jgi:hypothetical protein
VNGEPLFETVNKVRMHLRYSPAGAGEGEGV